MNPNDTTGPARPIHGSPAVAVDSLREKLLGLGLLHAAEALAEELSEAVKHDRAGHVVLDRLLSRESEARDERVAPPVPLGKLGRRLQEIVLQPVEQRRLDLYAALAEVSR